MRRAGSCASKIWGRKLFLSTFPRLVSPGSLGSIDPFPDHGIVAFDPFDVLGIFEEHVADQSQQGRGEFRGRAEGVQRGTFHPGRVAPVAVFHPPGVEIHVLPSPADHRLDARPGSRNHVEQDSAAVTSALVAVQLQEAVVVRRKVEA